ncbi:PDDEXK nuclease domain-containing protein [Deltaproteobacteria bacterium TL4]
MKQLDQQPLTTATIDTLYQDIKQLIEQAKAHVVTQVNQALVLTYWQIGKMIKIEVLQTDRAQYGASVLKRLAERLIHEYGNGFSHSSLTRMAKFYDYFPNREIVVTLSQQLSWSHFVEIIKIEDDVKREFYISMCANARWSVRLLRERMDNMLYERTAISKQPDALIQQELALLQQQKPVTSQLFLKDPYLLDFLDLKDNFTEKDLEDAILSELERFILELGSDFAFLSRQRRIQIGSHDYYIDLLFYHRKLKRLVLIELKLGEFKAEYKGQVELYLKWLAKYEQQPDENSPIAIILCGGKDTEVIELLDLEHDHIHIAEYWLQLPPKAILQAKLHKAMIEAKARLEHQKNEGEDEA